MQLAELSALWWLSDSQAARRSANFAGTLLSANFAKRAGFLPEEPLVSEVKRRNLQCDHRPRIDLPKCTRISGSTDGIAHKTYCKFWATRLSVWKLRPIQILGSRRPSRISNQFKFALWPALWSISPGQRDGYWASTRCARRARAPALGSDACNTYSSTRERAIDLLRISVGEIFNEHLGTRTAGSALAWLFLYSSCRTIGRHVHR